MSNKLYFIGGALWAIAGLLILYTSNQVIMGEIMLSAGIIMVEISDLCKGGK